MNEKRKRTRRTSTWYGQLWKLFFLLLIPVGIFLPRLAAKYPDYIEFVYARRMYPSISSALGSVFGVLPFSVSEFVLFSLITAAVVLIVLFVIRLICRRVRLVEVVSFLLSLLVAVGFLLNIFYFAWGFNYTRRSLYENLELDVRERSTDELASVCEMLRDEANDMRGRVFEDESGVFSLTGSYREYFADVPSAYKALNADIPFFGVDAPTAKGVSASVGMSYAGIAGIYIPFFAEANVNVDQPALLMLVSAAHETAHYYGIAAEDEANFIGYLACTYSDNTAIRYSGIMLALINCGNALADADSERYKALYATYSPGVVRDLLDYNAYWDAFEGPIEETFDTVNDNYLKFNQQSDGIKSYGMMVDLLLAYYAKD